MTWVFWGAAAIITYAYVGYAGWLWIRSRWHSKPIMHGSHTPRVSLVMVVRNEARILERKLRNLLELHYPENCSEVVVVSDGSSDATNEILSRYRENPRVKSILNREARGKAAGLNDAIAAAQGEIVVFTDARQ
jgi:glycosyltransferase involved in cell wall biosynthesis